MVQKAMHFDPKVLLSAPRRSAGVPNASGTKALYTTSTYSFESHDKKTELRVLDIATGESHLLTHDHDLSDFNWLDNDVFACLQSDSHAKDGSTELYITSVNETVRNGGKKGFYIAGNIPAPAGNLKIAKLDYKNFVVVVSAQADPDGKLFNPDKAKKTHSTGKLYKNLFVRHWDRWESKEKNALFYGKLTLKSGKWHLGELTNALSNTGLESPVLPFGGTDNFDLSANQLVFVAKDPDLNPALNTKSNVYVVDLWENKPKKMFEVVIPGYEGAATCPCFSEDGKMLAFLRMKTNGYEADKNDVFLMKISNAHIAETNKPITITTSEDKGWIRSPQSICFSADGHSLLVTAEDVGIGKLFALYGFDYLWKVRPLTHTGYVSDCRVLSELPGKIFVSGSSLTDNSFFAIVDPAGGDSEGAPLTTWSNSNSGEGNKFGLKSSQVSSIWTPASNPKVNKEVHSIVVRPSNFDPNKKYPVAYLIHGGPQGAWNDSWSTRWNPAIFAEQGYIVVAPNPTGSTGYGQAFTDAIRCNWGGDPYKDIVNVFEWVGKNMSEADNDRAVALGASYGGYMMNWIQGHDLGRKFKCLVCHDGITTFAGAMLPTDELYFPFYDLGGTPWYDPNFKPAPSDPSPEAQALSNFGPTTLSDWRKWDPSEHFSNWATPQLVIHSSKDYRLPIAEGLAAFNVLQARGVESQFLTFDDENHWVLKPENSLLWHKVVLNWINKYAGLEAYADEEDEEELYGGLKENEADVVDVDGQREGEM